MNIKSLSEAIANPQPEAGLVTTYNGNDWQLTRIGKDQLGWYWKKIGGLIKPYEAGREIYFRLDDPIFDSPRYKPKASQKLANTEFTKSSEEITIPEEITDPASAWEYVMMSGYKPSTAAETFLKDDARCAYKYATQVLKRRFFAGEPVILKTPEYSERYKSIFGLI